MNRVQWVIALVALGVFIWFSIVYTIQISERRQEARDERAQIAYDNAIGDYRSCLRDQAIRRALIEQASSDAQGLIDFAIRNAETPQDAIRTKSLGAEYVRFQTERTEKRLREVTCTPPLR